MRRFTLLAMSLALVLALAGGSSADTKPAPKPAPPTTQPAPKPAPAPQPAPPKPSPPAPAPPRPAPPVRPTPVVRAPGRINPVYTGNPIISQPRDPFDFVAVRFPAAVSNPWNNPFPFVNPFPIYQSPWQNAWGYPMNPYVGFNPYWQMPYPMPAAYDPSQMGDASMAFAPPNPLGDGARPAFAPFGGFRPAAPAIP